MSQWNIIFMLRKEYCKGCVHSFCRSWNIRNCPYCNADRIGISFDDSIKEMMKRVESNDAFSIYVLGIHYYHGKLSPL
jgi:hypothetical protein